MARVHSIGDVINGFEIVEEKLGSGGYTMFYHAKKGGRDIFLKQYTSPAVSVSWYKSYLDYEKQIKRCIESNPIKYNTYEIVDIFEWRNSIYQAFEYVPNGKDLDNFLTENGSETVTNCFFWNKRVIFAKMLMDCIKKLHASKIVHCDLKPQNVVLIEDKSIKSGYLLRIADLDWSIIEGKTPPWVKDMGYVGTPDYFSPEHLRHKTPTYASDVFTCGIILYEILCNDSPFPSDRYEELVLKYKPKEPVLLGNYPDADNEDIAQILKLCLNPDPSKRPTAEEVHKVLLGHKGGGVRGEVKVDEPKTPVEPETPPKVEPPTPSSKSIQLVGPLTTIIANINTRIGKQALKNLCGDDSMYSADVQYTIVREGDSWFIDPTSGTTNETLLNGKKIVEKTPLKPGDQIGIGREAKGVVKAIVTVQ